MESHGPYQLLEMLYLQRNVLRWHGMEHDLSLEVVEQINSHILPMESRGLAPLLEMVSLQQRFKQSHGVEHDGWLEV
jgi:hypothetical protein